MTGYNGNRPGYKKTKVGWIPEEWACLPFTEVFQRATKQVSVKPNDKYRQIGIRSHCRGVFFKDEVTGKALGKKRVFWCQPGALVFNIVFAWEQAVAALGEETEGMIASHRFPMYRAKNGRANERFYLWFFSSPRGKHGLTLASPGGTGRNKTLGQGELDFLFLPVPPLPEQERIAAVLGAWDRAIGLTDRLIEAKQRLKKGLMQQLLTGRLRFPQFGKPARKHGELPKGWKMSRIQNIARVKPSTEKPKHENCTVSFFSMADISEEGRIATEQERPYLSVTNGFTSFQNGDILVAKITPCFQNGKGAHVKGLTNGIGYGSTEFHVVRPRKVDERFLFLHTQSRPFRARGEANMTGSAGQKRVPTDFIR
jgi:type I restriction enzyme, S subunit